MPHSRTHAPQVIALDDDAEDVLEELEVMRALSHINVVRVFDAFWAHQGRCPVPTPQQAGVTLCAARGTLHTATLCGAEMSRAPLARRPEPQPRSASYAPQRAASHAPPSRLSGLAGTIWSCGWYRSYSTAASSSIGFGCVPACTPAAR